MLNPNTNPVDYVLLDGEKSPGLAEIVDINSPRKWDQISGYASGGAVSRYAGDQLSSFQIVIRLYTDQDWEDWFLWKVLILKYPRGVREGSHRIWHPYCEEHGVTECVIKDWKGPKETGPGEHTITIDCDQYRKPVPQYAKPDGGPPANESALEKEVRRATQELEDIQK